MPEAIKVEAQAEQQRLLDLSAQAAARSARGQLAFDDRDHGLDLGALPIQPLRKSPPHLAADAHSAAAPALGGNDAARAQLSTNMHMVLLGVELGVGQHQAQGRDALGRIDQPRKAATIAPRAGAGLLGEDDLLIHIGDQQPLQPVAPTGDPARALFQAANKEGADRVVTPERRYRVRRKATRSAFSSVVSLVPRMRLKNSTVSSSVRRRPSCR